jgi:O-antigen ligase
MFKVFNYNFLSINFLFLILLILVPVSFIISPFFINLISSLIILIFISLNFKKIHLGLFKDKSIIACLIFCIYLIFNSILLNAEHSSKLHTLSFGRFIFFSYAVFFFLEKIKDKLKWISFAYFAISLFVSLDIIYQFIFQKDLFGFLPGMCTYSDSKNTNCERYSGVFGDEYIAGNFLATFGIFSFFLVLKNFNKSSIGKIISYLVFFIIFISIVLSGERSSLIIFFGVLILNAIFNKDIRNYLSIIISISIIALILSAITLPHVKHRLYSWPKLLFFSSNLESETLLKKAIYTPWGTLYLSGYETFIKNPFFGKGFKSFRKVCSENDIDKINKKYNLNLNKETTSLCSTHPHNIYIELLAEAGIIGLIFFLIMIYYLIIPSFIKNYSKLERKDITWIVFFIILLIITPFKPTGSISASVYGTSIWFFIGFYLYFVKNFKNKL